MASLFMRPSEEDASYVVDASRVQDYYDGGRGTQDGESAMQNPLSTAISVAAAITVAAGFTLAPARAGHAPARAQNPSPAYQAPRVHEGQPDLNGTWQAV